VAALQRQVAELQRRLQQPNATQHSTAAAADPAMPALRADLRQLQATLATLQQERRQSDSAAPELQQLRQQVGRPLSSADFAVHWRWTPKGLYAIAASQRRRCTEACGLTATQSMISKSWG